MKSHIFNRATGEKCSYCVGELTKDEQKSIDDAAMYQEFITRMCRHKTGPNLEFITELHTTVRNMTVRAYHQLMLDNKKY